MQGIGFDVVLNPSLVVTEAHEGQKVTTGDAKPITNVVASPFAPKNKSVNGEKDVFVSFREFVKGTHSTTVPETGDVSVGLNAKEDSIEEISPSEGHHDAARAGVLVENDGQNVPEYGIKETVGIRGRGRRTTAATTARRGIGWRIGIGITTAVRVGVRSAATVATTARWGTTIATTTTRCATTMTIRMAVAGRYVRGPEKGDTHIEDEIDAERVMGRRGASERGRIMSGIKAGNMKTDRRKSIRGRAHVAWGMLALRMPRVKAVIEAANVMFRFAKESVISVRTVSAPEVLKTT